MKSKKINRIVVGALVFTIMASTSLTGATMRTSSFNTTYLKRFQENGNVLKADMDENGQVTYSTTSSPEKDLWDHHGRYSHVYQPRGQEEHLAEG